MRYSYNWLCELGKTKKKSDELSKMIGLRAFEFDGKENLAERFDKIVIGKILEIKKHPNADKLQVTKVDVGGEKLNIVCGAQNIKVGDKVPVALIGAVLPAGNIIIEKTKIRGIVSSGMLCAEDELGLGKDHEGIMILEQATKVGEPLHKALAIDDDVLEFDVLPNRAHDCLSYEGMAREIAAMEGRRCRFTIYDLRFKNKENNLSIEIKDEKLCPRYIGAVLKNVKIGKSPAWMQSRLVASGMEPINNVVDITNYVMLEVGSPLHAFDFEKIKSEETSNPEKSLRSYGASKKQATPKSRFAPMGQARNSVNGKVKIVIRKARKDEKLELLDGTSIKLDERDLVIANEEKVLALAGIKGGKESGINNQTSQIVLEAANFQPLNIRKSRQRHALITESQTRFEKGISPELAERAAVRAIELFEKYTGAKLNEVVDADCPKLKKQEVILGFNRLEKLLGVKVSLERAIKILNDLGFEVNEKNSKQVKMAVPFWRLDIEGPEDLMEEVGRIVGYENIKEAPIVMAVEPPYKNKEREFEEQLADKLIGLEFDEVRNYSFYSAKDIKECGIAGNHIELQNPLSEELTFLRQSMLPGILRNVALNQKHFNGFSIFETGRVYLGNLNGKQNKIGKEREPLKLAGAVFCGKHQKGDAFYLAKGKIQALLMSYDINQKIEFKAAEKFSNKAYHLTRSAKIMIEGKDIGEIGEIESEVAGAYHIKKKAVVFEIDFAALQELASQEKRYEPLQKFPTVLRDTSMFVDLKTETGSVIQAIQKAGGSKLEKIKLFDVYLDKKNNRKSLAFHLTFEKDDRTMKSEEIDEIISKITKSLEKKGIQVRKG